MEISIPSMKIVDFIKNGLSSGGIYAIINTNNWRSYVGSAYNIKNRISKHLRHMNGDKHCNKKLLNDYKAFGPDGFYVEVLEQVKNDLLLIEREDFWRSYGENLYNNPKKINTSYIYSESDKERFLSFIKNYNTDACWEWTGAKNDFGYGLFQLAVKKTVSAHRFSYFVHNKILHNNILRHACNNSSCVNPKHLINGTFRENAADTIWSDNGANSKVTAKEVGDIRALFLDMFELNYYEFKDVIKKSLNIDVGSSTLRSICLNLSWYDKKYGKILKILLPNGKPYEVPKGENSKNSKLNMEICTYIRSLAVNKISNKDIPGKVYEKYNIKVSKYYLWEIINNHIWHENNYSPPDRKRKLNWDVVNWIRSLNKNLSSSKIRDMINEKYNLPLDRRGISKVLAYQSWKEINNGDN